MSRSFAGPPGDPTPSTYRPADLDASPRSPGEAFLLPLPEFTELEVPATYVVFEVSTAPGQPFDERYPIHAWSDYWLFWSMMERPGYVNRTPTDPESELSDD